MPRKHTICGFKPCPSGHAVMNMANIALLLASLVLVERSQPTAQRNAWSVRLEQWIRQFSLFFLQIRIQPHHHWIENLAKDLCIFLWNSHSEQPATILIQAHSRYLLVGATGETNKTLQLYKCRSNDTCVGSNERPPIGPKHLTSTRAENNNGPLCKVCTNQSDK